MSNLIDLGTLSSVTTGASTATTGSQLLPGSRAIGRIFSPDAAFAGSAKIQVSIDGSWVDVGTPLTSAGSRHFQFTLGNAVRLNCTARTAGSVGAVVEGDVD